MGELVFCIDCRYCELSKDFEETSHDAWDFDYECHKYPKKAKKISYVDKKEYIEWPECYMVNSKGECLDYREKDEQAS